jgi:hypothetical protein
MPGDPSLAHLLGRLAVVEARVQVAVARRRGADPNPDDGFRGLYLAEDQVDRLLARDGTSVDAASPGIDDLLAQVEAAADAAEAAGDAEAGVPHRRRSRLRQLADAFELTALDLEILLTALAPDLDPRFEKLYGYLHDDVTRRRASVGLALELAGRSLMDPVARGRVGAAAPLLRHGLLEITDPALAFLARPLRVPDRVAAHLLGDGTADPALDGVQVNPAPLATRRAGQLARALGAGVALAYLRQPAGCDALAVAAAAIEQLAVPALAVDLAGLAGPGGATDVEQAVTVARAAAREARLTGAALLAGPVDQLGPDVVAALAGAAPPVVLFGAAPWDPAWSREVPLTLDLDRPDRHQQAALWAAALDLDDRLGNGQPGNGLTESGLAGNGAATLAAVQTFRLGPGQIERAVTAARALASAEDATLGGRHLAAGARAQNGVGLDRLARHVSPEATWDDLVLPADALAGLQHLAARVAHRDRLLDDWALRRGGSRGEAVTALFVGESGTGKTLAAEVIAGALGLDLYVIDLSTVVDKYVGETEKNLERVFTGAEGVNGVLFFDEADALFGKRSEVSDARDRYANIEVAYLLQRMESFDGLAILATNLKANLDDAFARRLSLVVEFNQPEVDERRRLWGKSFGAVPLGADVDLDFCATAFRLAGGDIRNVAVTAACFAAAGSQVVTMADLVRAIQLEYRKLGRLCGEAEFGPYFALLNA